MKNPLIHTTETKKLIKEIERFLREDLLATTPVKTHLLWLYEMLYLPGTIENKLAHLPNLRLPFSAETKLKHLQEHKYQTHFSSPHLSTHFDKLVEKLIAEIHQKQAQLLNPSQQKSFVRKQLKTPISYYHYEYSHEPTAQEIEKTCKHAEQLYNIVRLVHYLYVHEVTENYLRCDPLKYTVLPKALAQELQLKFRLQRVENLLNYRYSITFYGEAEIFNELDDILHPLVVSRMMHGSLSPKAFHYKNSKSFAQQLDELELPEILKEDISKQFTQALTGVQDWFKDDLIDLSSQSEFYQYKNTQTANQFQHHIQTIHEQPDDKLTTLLNHFLSSNWLEQLTEQQQLEALYTLLYTPGHIQDKLDKLDKHLQIPSITKHIEKIKNSPHSNLNKEHSIIKNFNHQISTYIDSLQAKQARLLNFQQQYEFAIKQIEWDISSYTYYSPLPINEQHLQELYQALQTLFNITRKIEYDYKYHITEVWENTNVLTVTVMNQHLAQILSFEQALKPGINTPGDQKVSVYGQTWILDQLHKTIEQGFHQPIEHYSDMYTKLKAIQLPTEQEEKIINSFTKSMNQLNNTLNECNIIQPAIIATFNPISKKRNQKNVSI